ETVKGYAAHEQSTFLAVTQARSAISSAGTAQERMAAENALTGTLKSLFAVAEAYPELKADVNFQKLQDELSETEDKISYMRQSYNDMVMKFNTAIQVFPAVLIAGMLGFTPRESFDADAQAEKAPVVDFGTATQPAQMPVQGGVPAPQEAAPDNSQQ
ncbi:MAG: LemA family protein, partial [Eggerthellaceae bacterium]|nr:LemA family protein [Eggerthellaceae bacterium]